MRGLVCCAILLLACVFVEVQGDCHYEGETLTVGDHYRKCMKYTCLKNGAMTAIGCAESLCRAGEEIGFQEMDLSKPYPDCCPKRICKSN